MQSSDLKKAGLKVKTAEREQAFDDAMTAYDRFRAKQFSSARRPI